MCLTYLIASCRMCLISKSPSLWCLQQAIANVICIILSFDIHNMRKILFVSEDIEIPMPNISIRVKQLVFQSRTARVQNPFWARWVTLLSVPLAAHRVLPFSPILNSPFHYPASSLPFPPALDMLRFPRYRSSTDVWIHCRIIYYTLVSNNVQWVLVYKLPDINYPKQTSSVWGNNFKPTNSVICQKALKTWCMPMGKKYFEVKLKKLCIFGSIHVKKEYILKYLVKKSQRLCALC